MSFLNVLKVRVVGSRTDLTMIVDAVGVTGGGYGGVVIAGGVGIGTCL